MAKKKKASTPLLRDSSSLRTFNHSNLGQSSAFAVGESSRSSVQVGGPDDLVVPSPQLVHPSAGPIPRRDLELIVANYQHSITRTPVTATVTNGTVTSSQTGEMPEPVAGHSGTEVPAPNGDANGHRVDQTWDNLFKSKGPYMLRVCNWGLLLQL